MKIATNETSTGFLMQYSKFKYIATRIFLQKILHQRTKPGHASFWMYKSRIHITYKVHLLQTVRAFLQKLQRDFLNIIPSHRWAPALRRSQIPRINTFYSHKLDNFFDTRPVLIPKTKWYYFIRSYFLSGFLLFSSSCVAHNQQMQPCALGNCSRTIFNWFVRQVLSPIS